MTGTLALATVVVAIGLWALGQDFSTFISVEAVLRSLGLLSAMLAGNLLALTLYMMARIPWIEKTWSRKAIIQTHRVLGFTTFGLIVTHLLLIIPPSQDNPLLSIALWGTIIMLIVVVTSIRIKRGKKHYQSWHRTHLSAYIGIALAIPHMVLIGQDLANPVARVYWLLLFGLGFASCFVYRLVLPRLRKQSRA